MESWLSGRRRTIGNRVGVMSVSRVQIPDSPPDYRTLSKDKVRFLLFSTKKHEYFSRNEKFECNPECNAHLFRFGQGRDQRIHPCRAVPLHLVADMDIGLQCERGGVMPQIRLHCLDIVPIFQRDRRK